MKKVLLVIFFLAVGDLAGFNNPRLGYHTRQGEKAYSRGAYETATSHFLKAIEKNEPTGEAAFFLANILEIQKDYSESLYYLHMSIDRGLSKQYKKSALWKAIVYSNYAGDYASVLEYIEKLEKLKVKSKKLEKLKEQAAEQLTPDNMRAQDLEKIIVEKEQRLKGRQPTSESIPIIQELLGHYQELLRIKPERVSLRWKIAESYVVLNQPARAWAEYIKIAEEMNSSQAWYKVGVYSRKAGQYQKALNSFAKVLDRKNVDPELIYYVRINAAQAHLGLKNYSKAMIHAKLAQSQGVSNQKKQTAQVVICLSSVSPYVGAIDGLAAIQEEVRKNCTMNREPDSGLSTRQRFLYRYGQWKASWLLGLSEDEQYTRLQQILVENGTIRLPNWIKHEVGSLARAFFNEESFRQLNQLLSLRIAEVQNQPEHSQWQLAVYLDSGQYSQAIPLLLAQPARADEQEVQLLLCYEKLNDHAEIIKILESYEISDKSKAVRIVQLVDDSPEFMRLAGLQDYQQVRDKILGITQPDTPVETDPVNTAPQENPGTEQVVEVSTVDEPAASTDINTEVLIEKPLDSVENQPVAAPDLGQP